MGRSKRDGKSAVQSNDLTREISGIRPRQKSSHTGDFFRAARALEGQVIAINVVNAEPFGLDLVDAVGTDAHLGVDKTWSDRIDEDALGSEFQSQTTAILVQRRLGHGVGAGAGFGTLAM